MSAQYRIRGKTRRALEFVHADLLRGVAFLQQADVVVARRRQEATTTEDYTRPDGAVVCPINKEIGSQLCGLWDAAESLKRLLEERAP